MQAKKPTVVSKIVIHGIGKKGVHRQYRNLSAQNQRKWKWVDRKLRENRPSEDKPWVTVEHKQPVITGERAICITHKQTEELHRVPVSLLAQLQVKGFTHTTKKKFRAFKKKVKTLKPADREELYDQFLLKY